MLKRIAKLFLFIWLLSAFVVSGVEAGPGPSGSSCTLNSSGSCNDNGCAKDGTHVCGNTCVGCTCWCLAQL